MSAGIMPDIYRHTARKSTVSRLVKSSIPPVPLLNTSTEPMGIHFADFDIESTAKEGSIFETLEYNIKTEEESPQQPFVIVADNEMEEIQGNNDEMIIFDLVEQMKNQIVEHNSFNNSMSMFVFDQIDNGNPPSMARTYSTDTNDVHYVMNTLVDHIGENDRTESLKRQRVASPTTTTTDVSMEDINRSRDEDTTVSSMDSELQQSSMALSQSQIDDEIVEIAAGASNNSSMITPSSSCSCQCHTTTTSSSLSHVNMNTNEFVLFEQSLRQTRQKQQTNTLMNSRLIQMLKRQHQELFDMCQQRKIQRRSGSTITFTDREQQTISIHRNDSQIQTEMAIVNGNTVKSNAHSVVKPTVSAISNSSSSTATTTTGNHNGLPTGTRTLNNYFPAAQPSVAALQQLLPRVPANTTILPKTTPVVPAIHSHVVPQSQSAPKPHDIVDLTEEDEDERTNRTPSTRAVPLTQQQASTTLSRSTSSTSMPASTASATRARPPARLSRPNNATPSGQTFPLRPLPEHSPCDHTIARPQLSITQENATVRLTWNLHLTPMESIQNYEIFAYKQNATVTASDWKKIGIVKSMRLPMAVTLKEFQSNSHYAFAVRAVATNNNVGPFCEPKTICTGNTPVQPLHTSQLLNVPVS